MIHQSKDGRQASSSKWEGRGERRWFSTVIFSNLEFQVHYPGFHVIQALLGVELSQHKRTTMNTNIYTNFTSQRMAAVSHFAHRCANPYALNPDTNSAAHASTTLGVLVAGLKCNKQTGKYRWWGRLWLRKSKISSEKRSLRLQPLGF